jgi:uncharacterized repeat protein (TIGR02543 family)/prepilin-type N-terminal cleavage/methylation domain-containing protein
MKNKKFGFTLLEIILVMGILAVLAGIVIIAINPSRQLAQARNVQRKSDLVEVNKALTQYFIDHKSFPSTITSTLTDICNTGNMASSTVPSNYCDGYINLSVLVPDYLVAIPADPLSLNSTSTNYRIIRSSAVKVGFKAQSSELAEIVEVNMPELYTVTFDSDGGSAVLPTTGLLAGSTTTLPSEPTRSDYDFDGWYTQANGAGSVFNSNTAITGNIIVYAKWTAIVPPDPCLGTPAIGTICDGGAKYAGQYNGYKYMMATVVNNSKQWSTTQVTTGVTDIYSGDLNTQTLVNLGSSYPAAIYCDSLNNASYTDWFLPAREELNVVLRMNSSALSLPTGWYWSSTEESATDAKWVAVNRSPVLGFSLKTTSYIARCVRKY